MKITKNKWLEDLLFDLMNTGYTRAEINIEYHQTGRIVVKARDYEWGWQPLWEENR